MDVVGTCRGARCGIRNVRDTADIACADFDSELSGASEPRRRIHPKWASTRRRSEQSTA